MHRNSDGRGSGVCACVCPCVHDVFAIYDDNILSRLIMIIIKIIILYFIQISRPANQTLMISPQLVYGLVTIINRCLV